MITRERGRFARLDSVKTLWITILVCLAIVFPAAHAAPVAELVWKGDLAGDKTVTFLTEPGTGKLIFYDLEILSRTGAGVIINVERNNTVDRLQLTFNDGIVEAYFLNDNLKVITGKHSGISCCNPLSITILDGKLTIFIGDASGTADNVSAFQGSLTAQSVVGGAEAYKIR